MSRGGNRVPNGEFCDFLFEQLQELVFNGLFEIDSLDAIIGLAVVVECILDYFPSRKIKIRTGINKSCVFAPEEQIAIDESGSDQGLEDVFGTL